jgi:2-iminobutanoate/2-iminopropanoate deaminase
VVQGDIVEQTRRVMENLSAVLRAAGVSLSEVVRSTIYLTNLGDFGKVNEVYGSYFPTEPPARATVQVSALPRGASIEIDMIAHAGA